MGLLLCSLSTSNLTKHILMISGAPCVAIANLIIRLWEMRKGRRDKNDDPNQSGT